MLLVIVHEVSDGYTYSCTNTVPVEYESAEAFAVDFEEFCMNNKTEFSPFGIDFAGQKWSPDSFFEEGVYYAPRILTVDEWFAS